MLIVRYNIGFLKECSSQRICIWHAIVGSAADREIIDGVFMIIRPRSLEIESVVGQLYLDGARWIVAVAKFDGDCRFDVSKELLCCPVVYRVEVSGYIVRDVEGVREGIADRTR